MIKWTKQITAHFVEMLIREEKNLQKAIAIFDAATEEYTSGYRHDHRTFGVLISRLVSSNQFQMAETLLTRMKDEKCHTPQGIFLSICKAYGRVHKPLDAIRVFRKMSEFECKPTENSYITILDILVGENQLKMAVRFYRYMKEMGIRPCVASLNVLIKGLCKDCKTLDNAMKLFREMPGHGCVPDSYTYGTLINGLCRQGDMDEAKRLFVEMAGKGCVPTVITYTCLINCLCQNKGIDEALLVYKEMKKKNIIPNRFTYSALMGGLCRVGRSSDAMEFMEKMISKCLLPNTVIYSTLIHGFCNDGKIEEATDLLDRMKVQGLKPDAGLYSKIINGQSEIFKYEVAANFLDEMFLDGISPNRLTWCLHVKMCNRVIQGLCSVDAVRAFQLYNSVRNRGISIDAKSFDSLIACFSLREDVGKVCRLMDEMVIDGCVPNQATWLAMVNEISHENSITDLCIALDKCIDMGGNACS